MRFNADGVDGAEPVTYYVYCHDNAAGTVTTITEVHALFADFSKALEEKATKGYTRSPTPIRGSR